MGVSRKPILIVLASLLGARQIRLADDLGRARSRPVLSVDPVEAGVLQVGFDRDDRTGLAAPTDLAMR